MRNPSGWLELGAYFRMFGRNNKSVEKWQNEWAGKYGGETNRIRFVSGRPISAPPFCHLVIFAARNLA